MKSVDKIKQTKTYKQHTFAAAIKEFACDNDVSLYYDGLSNLAIIYHLKDSKNIHTYTDEIKISSIPNFLKNIEDFVSEEVYDTLQEIYDKFLKLANQYGYEDNCELDLFTAYGITEYPEMWKNKEFSDMFKNDVADIVKLLQPIQDLVVSL